ncbi:hypothetical protein CEXT_364761 [Caerostris extrusa]|uniref:Ycf1 n=1 Tax=Caerostris extrusa TaxID=172846 RepID=A0AAV4XBJ1_CAEEX|nr:hypothetical protein CEXT_364761 [Caerostris extrusa]
MKSIFALHRFRKTRIGEPKSIPGEQNKKKRKEGVVEGDDSPKKKRELSYDQEVVDNVEEWNLRSDFDLAASQEEQETWRISSAGV